MPSMLMRALVGVAAAMGGWAAASADQLTFYPAKDNTLYESADGSISNGRGPTMYVGRTNQSLVRRAVLAYDLSHVPPGSTITQVTLTLEMTRTRLGTGTPVSLYRALADWGEGASNAGTPGGSGTTPMPGDATWIHRFYPNVLWASPGGEFAATASATTSVGSEGTYSWSSAGMVADVQQWVDNPGANFGWVMRGTETSNATTKQFETRQSNSMDPTDRPMLRVTFTPPAGAGACCLPNGQCAVALPAGCSELGGVFQGEGVLCSSAPCPLPTGACCLASGLCQTLTAPGCAAAGGTYSGDGVPCGTVRCPVVLAPFVDALPIIPTAQPAMGNVGGAAAYVLPITQFRAQLHRDLPPTTVWGIGGTYPGPTIEASVNNPVSVTWINDLRDDEGEFLQHHYLPVDMCLNGPMQFGDVPRIVIHLHGGHVAPESDGDPLDTLLPGELAVYDYPNIQDACTLWYHDHSMGITRLNVYMGVAGMYLIRDPAESSLNLPSGEFEVPLVIQDRSFNPDGSLYYPGMWEDHFFGDTVLVNGKVWPYLNVKRGKYRFRILNGSNSRTYRLSLSNGAPFYQIGSDQGLLTAPVTLTSLTVAPSERVDVVMDFATYAPGSQLVLTNSAPTEFPGTPGVGVIPNVMKFSVTSEAGHTAALPQTMRTIVRTPESEARVGRSFDIRLRPDACHGSAWLINGLRYNQITELPRLNTTEVWTFINRSSLMHPMHMHLVRFQILDRQPFQIVNDHVQSTGPRVAPPASEMGWKDTVQAYPSEITRVIARFETFTGNFPYHCHILEHEDNEMMRQFQVLPECPCDRNSDSRVDSGDFFSFMISFFNNNADINHDGQTTSQDFFDFMTCFFAGCG